MQRYLFQILFVFAILIIGYILIDDQRQDQTAFESSNFPSNLVAITPATMVSQLNAETNKPEVLVLYASWCPFCKKQMDILKEFNKTNPEVKITAISIDKKPQAMSDFIAERPHLNFFTPYVVSAESRGELKSRLSSLDLQFRGGIPFLAFFKADNTLYGQASGLVGLDQLLATFKE